MNSLPEHIEEITDEVVGTGHNSRVMTNSSSKSTIVQNGKPVVVKTANGKTTITVDGKEYGAKEGNG